MELRPCLFPSNKLKYPSRTSEGASRRLFNLRYSASGVSSWWLLAPNTPRQDRRPCTRRKNSIFAPVSVSTPVDQGANRRFSPWTPSSFSAYPRCRKIASQSFPLSLSAKNDGIGEKGAGSAEGEPFGLPFARQLPEKTESRNFKFRRWVQGPWSCRGVLGARSHQPKTPEAGNREAPRNSRRNDSSLFSQFGGGESGVGFNDSAEIIDVLKSGAVSDFADGG